MRATITAAILAVTLGAAAAAQDFDAGMRAYDRGDFASARVSDTKGTSENPGGLSVSG
jgi:hypothetical protein